MRFMTPLLAATALATTPAIAEDHDAPDLVVVISIDQLSSDLFEQYAPLMSGGIKRLANEGTVYANGYQAQSATETCPGHSTILTGSYPARSGIVANVWGDLSIARDNKTIYCAEDPLATPGEGQRYVVSDKHLLVPTLGTYLKAAQPGSRNVAVAGKDRSAVMLSGHDADQRWWWMDGWTTDLDGDVPASVPAATQATQAMIDAGSDGLVYPAYCEAKSRVIDIEGRGPVGNNKLGWAPGEFREFRTSPAYDGAVLALGAALIQEMQLGQGDATDVISLGLSATDYVGHSFGPEGGETCLQMYGLDQNLGAFLTFLDNQDFSYSVVFTADHGGLEIPERLNEKGVEEAERIDPALEPVVMGAKIGAELGIAEPFLFGDAPTDVYVGLLDQPELRARAILAAKDAYEAHPQIEAAYTEAELMALPIPSGDPTNWTSIQRVRATYHPDRSGDLMVIVKPLITPIAEPSPGYISTHGSPWDYDRRVPIIFFTPDEVGEARAEAASTVDILPTIAANIGLSLGDAQIDGQCLAAAAECGN